MGSAIIPLVLKQSPIIDRGALLKQIMDLVVFVCLSAWPFVCMNIVNINNTARMRLQGCACIKISADKVKTLPVFLPVLNR